MELFGFLTFPTFSEHLLTFLLYYLDRNNKSNRGVLSVCVSKCQNVYLYLLLRAHMHSAEQFGISETTLQTSCHQLVLNIPTVQHNAILRTLLTLSGVKPFSSSSVCLNLLSLLLSTLSHLLLPPRSSHPSNLLSSQYPSHLLFLLFLLFPALLLTSVFCLLF